MRILAVDTSSERGSVCIQENGEILGEVRLRRSVQHSDRLFRSVDFLFRYAPFGLPDIDLFVAARGPGSFTGLRVGLAAMEAFAAAHDKPGAGVSTLEAVAWRCGVREQFIAPVIDARRGEVYGALYRRDSSEVLTEVRPPAVMPPEHWFGSLPDSEILFCGDGVLRYSEYVTRTNWKIVDVDLYLAAALAELAVLPSRGPLSPLYVRRTEAEIKRERQHESVTSSNPESQTF
jgi:tRNA threonylcarbamoyladenosine biosynthesis protein TsaB